MKSVVGIAFLFAFLPVAAGAPPTSQPALRSDAPAHVRRFLEEQPRWKDAEVALRKERVDRLTAERNALRQGRQTDEKYKRIATLKKELKDAEFAVKALARGDSFVYFPTFETTAEVDAADRRISQTASQLSGREAGAFLVHSNRRFGDVTLKVGAIGRFARQLRVERVIDPTAFVGDFKGEVVYFVGWSTAEWVEGQEISITDPVEISTTAEVDPQGRGPRLLLAKRFRLEDYLVPSTQPSRE